MQSTITRVESRPHFYNAVLGLLPWLELCWVAILAIPILFANVLPLPYQIAAVCALPLFWPIRWQLHRYNIVQWQALPTSLILIMSWLPVNLLVAVNGQSALTSTGYLVLGIVLFMTIRNQPWIVENPIRLGRLFGLLGFLLITISPFLVQWKSEFRLFYVPIYNWFQNGAPNIGETIHANVLGGILVPLSLIMVALTLPAIQTKVPLSQSDSEEIKYLRRKRHRADRLQWVAAMLIASGLLLLLLLTQSRGAYLGILAGGLSLLMIRWPRWLWLLLPLPFGLAAIIYMVGIWPVFELLGADNTFGGADWRTVVWRTSIQALHDFPYTGVGIGNFRAVLPSLYPHPVINNEIATHAHNLLLQISLDLGLPGLLSFLIFMLVNVRMGFSAIRQRMYTVDSNTQTTSESDRRYRRRLMKQLRAHNQNWALAAGSFAALIGIYTHGLLDAVTWGTKLSFFPWLVYALIWITYTQITTTPSAK